MARCKTCDEPIETSYTSAYGGDYYYSCNICDWHSEGDEHTMIKQGLTLEELIAHKKRLNKLYEDIHSNAVETKDWVRLNVLREIMDELLTTEED